MSIAAAYNAESSTMVVTLNGESKTFPVSFANKDFAEAKSVFACKFRTGAKLWAGRVIFWINSGRVTVEAGHSDKGGAVKVVGWYDHNSVNNSKGR